MGFYSSVQHDDGTITYLWPPDWAAEKNLEQSLYILHGQLVDLLVRDRLLDQPDCLLEQMEGVLDTNSMIARVLFQKLKASGVLAESHRARRAERILENWLESAQDQLRALSAYLQDEASVAADQHDPAAEDEERSM